MNIVIIKYNAGNIESVNNALRRLGVSAEITGDHVEGLFVAHENDVRVFGNDRF